MHIDLSAAFNAGDYDNGKTYADIGISSLEVTSSFLRVNFFWGNWDGAAWTDNEAKNGTHTFTGAPYTTLMATVTNDGETVSDGIHRAALQCLIDVGLVAGTVATGG